jgi:signal transduction histidine kinase
MMLDPWRRMTAVAYLVTAAMILIAGEPVSHRLGSLALLLACAAWERWCGVGITRWFDEGRRARAVGYVAVLFVLFVPAVWLTGQAAFLLFALIPQVYMALPLLWALGPVVVFSLVAWQQQVLFEGQILDVLPMVCLVAALSQVLAWAITSVQHHNIEQSRLLAELRSTQELNARLSHEAGVAAERERLSGEIHDTLAQGFTSIVTLVQAAQGDPASASKHLDLALRTARENLAEARTLVAALAPAALDESTLVEALDRQAERLGEDLGIPVRQRTTGDTRPLPTSVEVVLLRAAQEAFNNVRKHAQAKVVAVELAFESDAVRLEVQDDGRGFTGQPEGFGLRGMRSRVEQVGGTLTVSGESGTSLSVLVPL